MEANNSVDVVENALTQIDNEIEQSKNNNEKNPKIRILENILFYSAAPLIAVGLFIVFLYQQTIWPFGGRILSSYDMLAQIVPFAEHLFDVFNGDSSLFYSFSIAGGADTFGTLAYCMVSPFSFIFLLGGKGMVNYMVPFVLGAKIIVIALSATYSIKKLFPTLSPVIVVVLSILYTYSGYFHVANTYINWLDFMIYLPLAVVAFHKFMQTDKYLNFSICIAAMIYACFSIACFSLLIIYLVLFAYVYLVLPKHERKEKLTKICLSLILAIAFALPVILPAFMSYINSGRNTGLFENLDNALSANHLYSKLTYILCDAVFFTVGLYCLLTGIGKDPMNKFLWVATALIFAPVLIDEICLLLNAGSYMSYSLRFGFLNSMLGLYLTCKVLSNIKQEGKIKTYKWPISTVIGIFLVLICVVATYALQDIVTNKAESFVFTDGWIKEDTMLYTMFKEADFADDFASIFAHSVGGLEIIGPMFAVFGFSIVIVILCTKFKLMPVKISACVIIIISLIQTGFTGYSTVCGNNNGIGTYTRVETILDDISELENGDFSQYRIKDYNNIVTADAPLTLHYRSYSVFSSVINGTNFIPTTYFQYTGNGINSMKTRGGNSFSDCLFGYKYAYATTASVTDKNWERIETYTFGETKNYLFKNNLYFPTAFKIPAGEYSISEGTYADQLDSLYNYLGGEGNLTVRTEPASVKAVGDGVYEVKLNSPMNIHGDTFVVSEMLENYNIRYCESSTFTQKDSKKLDGNLKIDSGYNKSSRMTKYISIKCTDEGFDEQIIKDNIYIFTISYNKIEQLSKKAHENAVKVDFEANKIVAKTSATDNEFLFINYMAIPGYKAKINESDANLMENPLNFIVVDLKEGQNEINLKYNSPYIIYIIIALILGAGLAAGVIFTFKHYNRVKKLFERVADISADILAAGIFGFGFCYPFFLFIWKCIQAVFKI